MKLQPPYLSVAIWSEHHKKLAEWYQNTLGLKIRGHTDHPNDDCYDMDTGTSFFSIGKHDKVKGKSRDPYRMMVGLQVESVSEVYNELKDKKITWIAKPFLAPTGTVWCMTLQDPEGNIVQFFGAK
jgi:extradiol dioxygenase family protein